MIIIHKLYRVIYSIEMGKYKDKFYEDFLFTDKEMVSEVDTSWSFYEFFDKINKDGIKEKSKYPHRIITSSEFLSKKNMVVVYCIREDFYITERNFNRPTSIYIEYKECPTSEYSYKFFEQNLSLDDFKILLQERLGDEFKIKVNE